MYSRAKGIADHYWTWAVFFSYLIIYLTRWRQMKSTVGSRVHPSVWTSVCWTLPPSIRLSVPLSSFRFFGFSCLSAEWIGVFLCPLSPHSHPQLLRLMPFRPQSRTSTQRRWERQVRNLPGFVLILIILINLALSRISGLTGVLRQKQFEQDDN